MSLALLFVLLGASKQTPASVRYISPIKDRRRSPRTFPAYSGWTMMLGGIFLYLVQKIAAFFPLRKAERKNAEYQ
jgi:hypothetical protein